MTLALGVSVLAAKPAPDKSAERWAQTALSRMTLEEKIGQMSQIERENATADVVRGYFVGKYVRVELAAERR